MQTLGNVILCAMIVGAGWLLVWSCVKHGDDARGRNR